MDAGRRRVFAPTNEEVLSAHREQFSDFPNVVLQGSTEHFHAYYDPPLGNRGKVIAREVLVTCERDYSTISSYFSGIEPPGLPINIIIARLPENERAYHYGCSSADLYCDAQTMPTVDTHYTSFLAVALLVEVFEAAQGRGWRCDKSNGEALGRVLATAIYPRQIVGFATAASWLDGKRENFIHHNDSTDINHAANGCAVLFLNYLHYQLGYDWGAIVAAAGPTLVETYHRLTGDSTDPFPAFTDILGVKFPIGKPCGLTTDNPFPLAGPPPPPPPPPQSGPASGTGYVDGSGSGSGTGYVDGSGSGMEYDSGTENSGTGTTGGERTEIADEEEEDEGIEEGEYETLEEDFDEELDSEETPRERPSRQREEHMTTKRRSEERDVSAEAIPEGIYEETIEMYEQGEQPVVHEEERTDEDNKSRSQKTHPAQHREAERAGREEKEAEGREHRAEKPRDAGRGRAEHAEETEESAERTRGTQRHAEEEADKFPVPERQTPARGHPKEQEATPEGERFTPSKPAGERRAVPAHEQKASLAQIEKYLGGITYPIGKEALVQAAQRKGATERVLATLRRLPSRRYSGPADISKHVSDLK